MHKGERLTIEAAMCALYLRGSPVYCATQRRHWPVVLDTLLTSLPCIDDVARSLRSAGRYEESCSLHGSDGLEWGLGVVESGRAFTAASPVYPRGWSDALGAAAPPCAWVRGDLPLAPAVGVVGSRVLDRSDRAFASGVGAYLMSCGRTLVSGGAVGADSVATLSAISAGDSPRVVELLPCGLERAAVRTGACQISVCAPWDEFTTGQAMERNALIYAYGRRTVVVRARLRAGGTWHGAADALRRGLGDVLVRTSRNDRASRALVGLGGVPLCALDDLPVHLDRPVCVAQPGLFGATPVREPSAIYYA